MADANIIVIGGNADDQDHDIPGNTNPAWRVHQGSEDYIVVSTVTGSEAILLGTGTGIDDSAGCKVGISITSPQDKLHVATQDSNQALAKFTNDTTGHAAGDGCYVGLNSDETMSVWHKEDSTITFGTNDEERMRITNTGKVGVGTTSPKELVHVAASDSEEVYIKFTNSTTGPNAGDGAYIGLNPDESFAVWHKEDDLIKFGTNDQERMRIKNDGKVGIGTTSPTSKLHVKRTDGTLNDAVIVSAVESTVGNTQLRLTGVGTETSGAYGFGRWGAGMVFVNSNNTPGNYTGFQNINADGYGNCGINFVNKSHGFGTTEGEIHFYTRGGSGYNEAGRWDEQGNLGVGVTNPAHKIDVSGTAGLSTGTAWTNTSDSRVKQNVETIENALEKIEALRPVSFEYTQDYADCTDGIVAGQRYNSFIAQEYAEVFPDAVSVGPDLVKESPGEEPVVLLSDLKQFTPHDLNMYLVRAVQELSAQIKELKEGN